MKHVRSLITIVALGVLAPVSVAAQEPIKATTFDGKHVRLYPDGTWKPAITKPGPVSHLGAFDEPRQVTLYSRRKHNDYMKASFSFKHGIQNDLDLKVTRNEWELLYDNGDGGFSVGLNQNDRSRILDLGEKVWSELKKVPVVTALPEGARAGSVPAVQGHMYVVHTRTNSADLYSLFRVEWLEPGDQCVISWVNVPSPEANSIDRAANKRLQRTRR